MSALTNRLVLGFMTGRRISIEWGDEKHARKAMEIGRFMAAGCIDAPDSIPAGGCRSFDYGDGFEGVDFVEVPRESPR